MSNEEGVHPQQQVQNINCLVLGSNSHAIGTCSVAIGDNIVAVNGAIAVAVDPPILTLNNEESINLLTMMTLGEGMTKLFDALEAYHGSYKIKIVKRHVQDYLTRLYQRCVDNDVPLPMEVHSLVQRLQFKM